MFIPIFISYAEIHYHLKCLVPLYYKKMPEILADVPSRLITKKNKNLPILIIIKDSHLFPIELEKVTVSVIGSSFKTVKHFNFHRTINIPYFSEIIEFDISRLKADIPIRINVNFQIKRKNKRHLFNNDNYGLPPELFRCFLSSGDLPYPENWFAGDPHYHSSYTEDQVEFGADIPATIEMAKTLGLSWFFVTDHSYDLDDSPTDYTKNDPEHPKWKLMKSEISNLKDDDVKVIAGEEVSIGNHYKKNVHLLAINNDDFISGSGDSAEVWFRNKPSTYIHQIAELHNEENLFIAAHPWEEVDFMQKLTLRRDNWHDIDLEDGKINYIQLINGSDKLNIEKNLKRWKQLLLKGKQIFAVAGNDAHGNFNVMRQIKIPFIKLFSSGKQIFGRWHTVFNYPANDPVKGLKNGCVIMSNGPFLDFTLKRETKKHLIGSIISSGEVQLDYTTATTKEFGNVSSIRLIIGDCLKGNELVINNPGNEITFETPESGYIRMEMNTRSGGMVITNPIWVK